MSKKVIFWFFVSVLVISLLYLLGATFLYPEYTISSYLEYISSGIHGKEAMAEGRLKSNEGLMLHLLISAIWVVSFFGMYPNFKFKQPNWIRTGVVFGAMVSFIMNFGVIPIAITSDFPTDILPLLKSLVLNIVTVGLPLSFIYIRYIYIKPNARPHGHSVEVL